MTGLIFRDNKRTTMIDASLPQNKNEWLAIQRSPVRPTCDDGSLRNAKRILAWQVDAGIVKLEIQACQPSKPERTSHYVFASHLPNKSYLHVLSLHFLLSCIFVCYKTSTSLQY